ncbi:RAB interacting factor [Fasciola gigantica]|uniref:RAB interacting factor n=1 Tax=Fasciola gigantica TaxID=46835 RepID=A0A504YKD7_FASGI|nr:RAB interacting factor [Fasciola gigantica]
MAAADISCPCEPDENKVTLDGSNLFDICCPRCSSTVLRKTSARLETKQHSLPVFAKKSELTNPSSEFPTEELDQFWSVKDMYTFENVGFTHNVGVVRYLTCADCELGPIGFQDTSSDTPLFYVALARTRLKTPEAPNSVK